MGEDVENGDVQEESEESTWMAGSQKGEKNRPGFELNATRRSQSTINSPNSGKGENVR